jgi:uncharacterized PurR-regulated membrane protein YhhQ (DUF165 family)
MTIRIGIAAALAYISTIWAANWLISRYGLIHVGFGLLAPAGVFAAGLALTLRDIVHRTLGVPIVFACIATGAALSWWISPAFAIASATAFAVSELADLTVYTPLEERSWIGAVALSNTVGLVIDSVLFLWLAFGSLAHVNGQIVGKAEMTILAVLVLIPLRSVIPAREEARS